jgi:hypothetical protein
MGKFAVVTRRRRFNNYPLAACLDRRLFCDIWHRSAFCRLSSTLSVTAAKLALINLRASFIYVDGGRMRGA